MFVAVQPVQRPLGPPAPRTRHFALAAALGVCLTAVAALYAAHSPASPAELFEGFGSSGEDAALRQLYDADGERVPGAVVASQALAAADMPAEARRAVRVARDNLEEVRRAATAAAMLKADGAGAGRAGSAAGFDAAWKAEMDRAMGTGKGAGKRAAGHHTPTHRSMRSAVAKGFQDASEMEQSKDMLKENLETMMRRKMSAMKLDVQRQLREEREHQEVEERRRAKTMHQEVETLKKRMLKQREKLEGTIVELSTKAHHYKSEVDTIADGANSNHPLEKKAEPRARAPSHAQGKLSSNHAGGVTTPVATEIREEKLEEEVKDLKAEFAKQEARWKGESKRTSSKEHSVVEGNSNSAKVHKIEKIEQGYFSGSGMSSGVARSQMQDVVARESARKAAEEKRAVRQVLLKAAHVDSAAKAPPASPPSPNQQALSSQGVAPREKEEERAVDAHTAATTSETPVAAATEGPGAAHGASAASAGVGALGGEDAELKAKLQQAIAERNAAEVEAEGYVLQAKDREIAALEKELALNQRVLALKQMQEEGPALETTGPLLLPGAGPQFGGSVEASWLRPASVGDQRAAVDSSEGERMVFGEQNIAHDSTVESREPSMAGDGRGFSAQRGIDYGVASGGLQPQQAALELRPRSVLRPQRWARVGTSEGWPVDHVPVWSARVKALERRALADGFQLVPAHSADDKGILGGQKSTSGRAGPAMVAPQGRQALAAVKTIPPPPPREAEAASEAHKARAAGEGHVIMKSESDRKSSSAHVPQGLDGASLLDQIGREFFQGANSFFKAV